VTVLVNTDASLFKAQEELVRNPHYKGGPGLQASIVREGDFRTSKGLSGYERVVRLVNAVGEVFWGWAVVGRFGKNQNIVIQIQAADEDWKNGVVWESFLQSIEIP
jgi:hypothetical protein